jgi:hypothetical protein
MIAAAPFAKGKAGFANILWKSPAEVGSRCGAFLWLVQRGLKVMFNFRIVS